LSVRFSASRRSRGPVTDITITASDDGQLWTAWVAAPTGYIFGLAQRHDDPLSWEFTGWEPPGPFDADPGWRYGGDPDIEPHPDCL
jgi:hypothetical protein